MVLEVTEPENDPRVKAVSVNGGMFVAGDDDGNVVAKMFSGGEFQKISLLENSTLRNIVNIFTPNILRGATKEADRAICTCTYHLAHNGIEEQSFTFVVGADFNLRVVRTQQQQATLDPTVFSLVELAHANFGFVEADDTRPHLIQCTTRVNDSPALSLAVVVCLRLEGRCVLVMLECQFTDAGQVILSHRMTKYDVPGAVTDMCLSESYIWLMSSGAMGETTVQTYDMYAPQDGAVERWKTIAADGVVTEPRLLPNQDPRTIYSRFIFDSGRFSLKVLQRALAMTNREYDVHADPSPDLATIKRHTIKTIEDNIRQGNQLDYEPEQYRDQLLQNWSTFFDSCEHCWQSENIGLALVADVGLDTAYVVTSNGLEAVRSAEPVEAVTDAAGTAADTQALVKDEAVTCDDMHYLLHAIQYVREHIEPDLPRGLAQDPVGYSDAKAAELLDAQNEDAMFATEVLAKIRPIQSFLDAVRVLHRKTFEPVDDGMEMAQTPARFKSDAGACYIAKCFVQSVNVRLEATRDLLYLVSIVLRLRARIDMGDDTCAALSALRPRIQAEFCALYPFKWAATRPCDAGVANNVIAARFETHPVQARLRPTLVDLFVHVAGEAQTVRADVAAALGNTKNRVVLSYLLDAAKQDFLGFLLKYRQYEQIREYAMLVSDVSASAKYALGCAYLHHDELHKAKSSFLEAIVAIDANQDSEFETLKRYLEINGNVVPHLTKVEYYKVIMRAFEDLIPPRLDALEESDQPQKYRQLVAPFLVVDFANMAITALESQLAPYGAERDEDHDVQLSVLQSNVVKHTLQLGLQDRAFTAIMNVPNKTHQKNVLQSMTQVLCKRREYQTLVEFPFGDLEPAVVDILEKMADNINVRDAVGDVEGKVPNCYEVLYCFYVHRGNYKKAAREMYTLSQKFKVAGDEFLEHELKAYCNAICSLQLVSPQSQWLDVLVEGHLITKELDEIEGEYLLAQAYKDLSEMGTTPRVLNDRVEAATRTIISLVKEGMFDRAMTVSCSFQGVTDCLKHIFTGLASECVKLSRKQSPGEGGWVGALNDLNPRCTNVAGPASAQGQDDPLQPSHTIFINEMRCAAADRAWHLLRLFLAKHDATADNNFMVRCPAYFLHPAMCTGLSMCVSSLLRRFSPVRPLYTAQR